ncbi:dephospho-CoA kinase [Enterococcus olivae]
MTMILGVTGGIATGKSTVVQIFREHGFPIVDGDVVAREIVEPNQGGLAAIVETFGKEILHADGTLDRKKLGAVIFSDPEQRQVLNELLAPFLQEEISRQLTEAKKIAALVIADIPLLFEAEYDKKVDQTAVVYISEELQLQRLMMRDQLTEEQAMQRINSQLPIEEKKKRADIIFDNRGTKEKTRHQVEAWLKNEKFI